MAKIEHDWMDSAPAQAQASPIDRGRKGGLATRALSFLGEVLTGRAKPQPRPAEPPIPSTLSPYPEPAPALTTEQREAERAEQQYRQTLYLALKEVLDQAPDGRRAFKPLWAVEQNVKALGVRGINNMAPRMTQLALGQLDELADYTENQPLQHLRGLLVAKNEASRSDGQFNSGAPSARTPSPQAQAQAQATSPTAPTSGAPQRVKPPAGPLAPTPGVSSPARDEADDESFFASGNQRDAAGPEVLEGYGIAPFEPAPRPDFVVDLDMALPALRQKNGRGG